MPQIAVNFSRTASQKAGFVPDLATIHDFDLQAATGPTAYLQSAITVSRVAFRLEGRRRYMPRARR
jgi:hypothetical protein